MPAYRQGSALRLIDEADGLERWAVIVDGDGEESVACALTKLVGSLAEGDRVALNVTAVALELGTGGEHFVVWNLSRPYSGSLGGGRMMKLRYLPHQCDVRTVEEDPATAEVMQRARSLEGMPVAIGTLHSQLEPFAVAFKALTTSKRLAYLMTDGAALPYALSRAARRLRAEGIIDASVTCGNAFGAEHEAVNEFSGMLAARHVCRADALIVLPGIGVAGTDTPYGHSGIAQGGQLGAVGALGGKAVAIPRISFSDQRERHRGISHHTLSALTVAAAAACILAMPILGDERDERLRRETAESGLEERHAVGWFDVSDWPELLGPAAERMRSMGRSFQEDETPFLAAAAAARAVAAILEEDDGST